MGPIDFDIVRPDAAALVESLRAFGYTPKTALADLIDNSITAGSSRVFLRFHWAGPDSYIAVADNGVGMDEMTLMKAMRAGSRSPLEIRGPRDLGRFGLGLKTASFSQCRKLTVWSATAAQEGNARLWDLDYVGSTGEWRLLKTMPEKTRKRIRAFAEEVRLESSGTVVLWEHLDRIVDESSIDDRKAHSRFLEMVDETREHLAMVFHHYVQFGGLPQFGKG